MAYLDLSYVAASPALCDSFDVVRRQQSVSDANGRAVLAASTISGVRGIVTDAGPDDLAQLPEETYGERIISIVTQYRLRLASRGLAGGDDFQPDLVLWAGEYFKVISIAEYPQLGRGFVQALASATALVDPPAQVRPAAVGKTDASDASQQSNIVGGGVI